MQGPFLTVPNVITVIRLGFLPFFVLIALESPITGAIVAAFLGFTDFLDGWIARTFNQESEFGRIMDPISDRALVLVTFVVFTVTESLPLWYVIFVGGREILITIGTGIVFLSKKVRLDVNKIGKISSFAAMVATPCWVMYFETTGSITNLWLTAAIIGSAITIPTGYYSLIEYFRAFRAAP